MLLTCACFLLIVSDVTFAVVLLILSGRGVLRAMSIVGLCGCVILTVRPVSMIRLMVHPTLMPDFFTQIVLIDVVCVLYIVSVVLNRGFMLRHILCRCVVLCPMDIVCVISVTGKVRGLGIVLGVVSFNVFGPVFGPNIGRVLGGILDSSGSNIPVNLNGSSAAVPVVIALDRFFRCGHCRRHVRELRVFCFNLRNVIRVHLVARGISSFVKILVGFHLGVLRGIFGMGFVLLMLRIFLKVRFPCQVTIRGRVRGLIFVQIFDTAHSGIYGPVTLFLVIAVIGAVDGLSANFMLFNVRCIIRGEFHAGFLCQVTIRRLHVSGRFAHCSSVPGFCFFFGCRDVLSCSVDELRSQRVIFNQCRKIQLIVIRHDFIHLPAQHSVKPVGGFLSDFTVPEMLNDFVVKDVPVVFIKDGVPVQSKRVMPLNQFPQFHCVFCHFQNLP